MGRSDASQLLITVVFVLVRFRSLLLLMSLSFFIINTFCRRSGVSLVTPSKAGPPYQLSAGSVHAKQ